MDYPKFFDGIFRFLRRLVVYVLLLFANLFPFSDILIKKLSKRLHSIMETYKFQIIFVPLLILVSSGALAVAISRKDSFALFSAIKILIFSFLFLLLVAAGIVGLVRRIKG